MPATREQETKPVQPPAAAPDPQSGGQYVREADGSLTQVHATQPAEGRAKRDQAGADSTHQE
jgi:hypothetical protein